MPILINMNSGIQDSYLLVLTYIKGPILGNRALLFLVISINEYPNSNYHNMQMRCSFRLTRVSYCNARADPRFHENRASRNQRVKSTTVLEFRLTGVGIPEPAFTTPLPIWR